MISWLFKLQGVKEFWRLLYVTAWEVSFFHSLVRNQVLLWIFIWNFPNFFKTMHLLKLTNFSHSVGRFNCDRIYQPKIFTCLFDSTMISWSNWPISLNKFISISNLIEIICSEWPTNTLCETAGWRHSNRWFTLLHIFKTLPDFLAFGSSTHENLIGHWIIWNNWFGLVHHFGLRQYRFILFIFSNDSNVL